MEVTIDEKGDRRGERGKVTRRTKSFRICLPGNWPPVTETHSLKLALLLALNSKKKCLRIESARYAGWVVNWPRHVYAITRMYIRWKSYRLQSREMRSLKRTIFTGMLRCQCSAFET